MFNSLGLNDKTFNPWKRYFATAFALIITLGNVSFPIAVWPEWCADGTRIEIPPGPIERKWQYAKSHYSWSTRRTSASTTSSCRRGIWPAHLLPSSM